MNENEWRKEMQAIERETDSRSGIKDLNVNPGWISLLTFVGSIGLFFLGIFMIAEIVTAIFSGHPMTGNNVQFAVVFICLGLIGFVSAIASAGAAFYVKRGRGPATSTLLFFTFTPFYVILQMLFELPPLWELLPIDFPDMTDTGIGSDMGDPASPLQFPVPSLPVNMPTQ